MKRNIILLVACMALSACGIKPGEVEPPEGEGSSSYPRTYPDLGTDPQP